jgi:putative Holliday junction resolvase
MSDNILGFDFGKKRIGVAVGQQLTNSARPLTQINSIDWDSIDKLLEEWQPQTLIVGLPLNMDDSISPLAKVAKKFAKQLEQHCNLPTHLIDERLSSREALERLKDMGKNKPSKEEINSMAAAVILETWLHNQQD